MQLISLINTLIFWYHKLTPSLLNDAYMCHTFRCTGCETTHICVIQLNMPGADWRV